jgi:hypothetical protein
VLDRQRELLGRRRSVARRPVLLRPVGCQIFAVPDVGQDVRLGDPNVLEQMPGRIRHVGRHPVDGVVREIRHGGVKRQVGTPAVDEREELLAQDVAGDHFVLDLLESSVRGERRPRRAVTVRRTVRIAL